MNTATAKAILRYRNDPCLFVREALGQTGNFPKQDAILQSIVDNPRTVVRAPNGAGKTRVAAQAVLYASALFEHTYVVTTASSTRQMMLLWKDVHDLYRSSRIKLGGELLQTTLRFPKLRTICQGFSTDDAAKFEGFHEERIFVILDEAKSIPQSIFDAMERLLASGKWVRVLIISSPGSPIGPFYDCFNRNGDLYQQFHISMGESPYVRPEWIEERKKKWGENSPLYMSAVCGDFSIDADGRILIPLTYVQRIFENPPEEVNGPLAGGVDLAAGGGDESVFSIFRGNKQIALKRWNRRDTMVTCGRIINICKEFSLAPGNVTVDSGGLGGPICDRLRELGWDVNRFNFGGRSFEPDRYYDAGAEVWDKAREKIERQQVILIDPDGPDGISADDLKTQLCSRMTKPRSDGLIQLESKEEMRKRQLPSPDLADATILSMIGRRKCELNILNSVSPVVPMSKEEAGSNWLREHFRKAQAEADMIREARGEKDWVR